MENINFRASRTAPNPKEVVYWVDLTADSTGGVIKTFDGKKWNTIIGEDLTIDAYTVAQADSKFATKSELSTKADTSTLSNYALKTDLNAKANSSDVYVKTEADGKFATKSEVNGKANKSTTLAGYGITDAYTKTETDGKYATITNLNTKANSADVYTRTQVYTKEECEAKITEMIEAAMAPAT